MLISYFKIHSSNRLLLTVAAFFLSIFTPQAIAKTGMVDTHGRLSVPLSGSGLSAVTVLLLQANIPNCPASANQLRGTGRTVRCSCSALATGTGSVWGSGIYTDDSKICRAAVHAGVISSRGGVVTFRVSGGRASYAASTNNGVTSGKWGSWQGSFQFTGGSTVSTGGYGGGPIQSSFCPATPKAYRGSGQTVTCGCAGSQTRAGSVWGNGTYTDDSKICRAAVHAGVIGMSGGQVSFRMVGPRRSYASSSANGVSTGSYGPWNGSFSFIGGNAGAGPVVQRSFCPAAAKAYRGSGRTIECNCAGSETRAGTVWGSGIYTDDSKICRAAVHAGQIGNDGGMIRFRMVGPRRSYAKSTRYGVSSSAYGPWQGSFVFVPY